MINTIQDVERSMREHGINADQMEVGLTRLAGQTLRLSRFRDYSTRHGTLADTHKALFNAIFALAIDDFKGLSDVERKPENRRPAKGRQRRSR